MKRRARGGDIFSLSFLDVVSCSFGAVVLLLLISKSGFTEADANRDISALLARTFQVEDEIQQLSGRRDQLKTQLAARQGKNQAARASVAAAAAQLGKKQTEAAKLQKESSGLQNTKEILQRASITPATAETRDEEVGGIPVDSDYVIFIVDTSGSMQDIWPRVLREMENVLDIHPTVKGFQIMNDNGAHLIRSYRGKWIPDTPRRRKSVLGAMRNWGGLSNSSPVEGLEVALKTYAKPGEKVSVYIFGDDYTGSSYDAVIQTLAKLNSDKISGKRLAKVHAIGFLSGHGGRRFEVLMREVTRRHGGTFVALPQ